MQTRVNERAAGGMRFDQLPIAAAEAQLAPRLSIRELLAFERLRLVVGSTQDDRPVVELAAMANLGPGVFA